MTARPGSAPTGRRYVITLIDSADDPDRLAQVFAELEREGFGIVCHALAGRMRSQQRNDYLRKAATLLHAPSTWAGAVALAKEIDAFERRVWPIWSEAPPERGTAMRLCLFEARRLAGAALPSTARHLYTILKRGASCDFSAG